MKKGGWDKARILKDVEAILKEGSFNSRLEQFTEKLNREEISVPEEWQGVFNTLFENMLSEYPAFACCILAFQMGQIWQKYGGENGH